MSGNDSQNHIKITLKNFWTYLLPFILAFALPAIFGKNALWLSVPAAELLTLLLAVVLFLKIKTK